MKVNIIYQGQFREEKTNWDYFQWCVKLGKETFTYRTGLRHCTKAIGYGTKPSKLKDKSVIRSKLNGSTVFIHRPLIRDILHCLFLDARCGSESFNDFCDNYGYSSDSITALDVYRACMETKTKLQKVFGNKYHNYAERIEQWEI